MEFPDHTKCLTEPHDMMVEDILSVVRTLLVLCVRQALCVTDLLPSTRDKQFTVLSGTESGIYFYST